MTYNDGEKILDQSIGLLVGLTLEETLEQRCFQCHFKACHRLSRDSLELIVETWDNQPICLPCLSMKKKCYTHTEGLQWKWNF